MKLYFIDRDEYYLEYIAAPKDLLRKLVTINSDYNHGSDEPKAEYSEDGALVILRACGIDDWDVFIGHLLNDDFSSSLTKKEKLQIAIKTVETSRQQCQVENHTWANLLDNLPGKKRQTVLRNYAKSWLKYQNLHDQFAANAE